MIPAGTLLGQVQASLPGSPVVGAVAPGGQLVHLALLEGWWDAPPSTGTSTQKVNEHGAFLGPAYYGARVLQLKANIDGWSPGDSLAVARQLMSSLTLDTLSTLSVTDELGTLTAAVRQEGDPLLSRQGNRMVVSLSMVAPDSRRYTPASVSSTGLPVASGGFTLPVVLPLTTGGATVSSGVLSVTNVGDLDSQPVFTIYGPVPNWTITDGGGRQLVGADEVPAGRRLVIDTGARSALLDGTANRTVTGTWPVLRPGANEYRFNSSAYDAGALLEVSYRSAWR